jgi:hypothetical protein
MKRLIKKSSIDPNILDMDKIREIGEKQFVESGETSDPKFEDKCISFDYKDITIINPFMDETGRFEVDPIKYYGDAFLNSDFAKIVKLNYFEEPDDDYLDKMIIKDHDDSRYW